MQLESTNNEKKDNNFLVDRFLKYFITVLDNIDIVFSIQQPV